MLQSWASIARYGCGERLIRDAASPDMARPSGISSESRSCSIGLQLLWRIERVRAFSRADQARSTDAGGDRRFASPAGTISLDGKAQENTKSSQVRSVSCSHRDRYHFRPKISKVSGK